MSLNAGLTTIHEDDIAKHQAAAQSLVTKLVILESDDGKSGTALAGTGRRFVSTVSTAGSRRTHGGLRIDGGRGLRHGPRYGARLRRWQ